MKSSLTIDSASLPSTPAPPAESVEGATVKHRRSRTRLVSPLDGEKLASEWDVVADERDSLIEEGRDLSYLYILLPALKALSAKWLKPRKHVLDVGCGTGKFATEIAQECSGTAVAAIDPSRNSIRIATRRGGPANLTFSCSSVESFAENSGGGQFDLVIANMLFQNVASLSTALEACSKLLRPSGALVFAVPHPSFWPRYWKYDQEPWFRYDRELWIEAPFKTSLSPDAQLTTTHTHRPLSSYIQAFRSAGLCIDELVEPYPDAGLEGEYPIAWEFPRFLLGRCLARGRS